MMRTFVDQVQYNIGCALPSTHVVLQWIAMWAASVYTKYNVTSTGRTPHEIATGHRCKQPIAGIGERIHWKVPRKKEEVQDNLTSAWEDGIFFGATDRTNELIVGNKEGVFRCRDIRRMAADQRWSKEHLLEIQTSVEQYVPNRKQPQEIAIRFNLPPDTLRDEPDETLPRRAMIMKEDDEVHGYTVNCPGCRNLQAGLSKRKHTAECRKRMENELSKTEKGKERVDRANERITEEIARRVQTHVEEMNDAENVVGDDKNDAADGDEHVDQGASGSGGPYPGGDANMRT